ncbi:MAG: PDZ domain-containing protein [Lachnospiraceae bacterium]|nr:PDZ domain-containing protein [Lachnospiraceae bacterium]
MEENTQNEFVVEKIKERPLNKKKLLRRSLISAGLAVLFGLVASFTFLVLEPVISNVLNSGEEPEPVTLPEALNEKTPEEMLTENMLQETQATQLQETIENITLNDEDVRDIVSNMEMSRENYEKIYDSMNDYADELKDSMVTIMAKSSNVDWLDNIEVKKNTTYGIIITESNGTVYILADYSPFEKASIDTLTVTFADKKSADGIIKMTNKKTGLAVISVNAADIGAKKEDRHYTISSLTGVNSEELVGTPVVVLGSPMGVQDSMDFGMITSVFNEENRVDTCYKVLQTNIFGSESALGFVFNLNGQLLGVITNKKSGSDMKGVISAYGITELKKPIEKMMNGVELPYLGISGVDVSDEAFAEYNVPYGAYITNVEMNSPAMKAGIRQGDIITNIGLYNVGSYSDYVNVLLKMNVGQTINIKLLRPTGNEYKEMDFSVVVGQAE